MPVEPRATQADVWHRAFIALVPDAPTRAAWAAMASGAACAARATRLVPVDQLHMTLAFLGSISHDQGTALAAELASVAAALPPLHIERFEHWPSVSHPRLAVLVFEGAPSLVDLHARVCALVTRLGLPIDDHRPFRPHVTLARMRAGAACATDLPTRAIAPETSRFAALTLYSSTLERSGARYRALASVPLA